MGNVNFICEEMFDNYKVKQKMTLNKHFGKIKSITQSPDNFDFYFTSSAVYSSMIEGNQIDLDSFMKYAHSGMNTNGKSFIEIQDLKSAYIFAQNNTLTLENFLISHSKISETLLTDNQYKGNIRDKDVFVFKDGIKIFTGAKPTILNVEMEKLFSDIQTLLNTDLSIDEVFYYASMLHLTLVQIHPFADGNGRASRLLEKWFLVEKLGFNAWFIQSEKFYQKKISQYYKNVNLGNDYENINYKYSLPFLLMLPMSLKI